MIVEIITSSAVGAVLALATYFIKRHTDPVWDTRRVIGRIGQALVFHAPTYYNRRMSPGDDASIRFRTLASELNACLQELTWVPPLVVPSRANLREAQRNLIALSNCGPDTTIGEVDQIVKQIVRRLRLRGVI